MRGIGNFYDQPVGRLGDAADLDAVQRAAQSFAQFVQEETAIAALEPQLVVVNDNVRGCHHSQWPLLADARSIQPPASHSASERCSLGLQYAGQASPFGPTPLHGETGRVQSSAKPSSNRCAKQLTP